MLRSVKTHLWLWCGTSRVSGCIAGGTQGVSRCVEIGRGVGQGIVGHHRVRLGLTFVFCEVRVGLGWVSPLFLVR